MLIDLSKNNSLVNQYISELRNVLVQTDRLRFKRNIERLGEIVAYEISKRLGYKSQQVNTPLGSKAMQVLAGQPVVGTILRAGLPFHQGILNFFDGADNCFLAAYRKHSPDGSFEIAGEYVACPSLEGRVLILADPMLATGRSILNALQHIAPYGTPSEIHIAAVIAAKPGVEYLMKHQPNLNIWVTALDDELNSDSYIIPGLGDAGDLCFGEKLQR